MPTPEWTPCNTLRAQALRRQATPAGRALWHHLVRSQLGVKSSRQMPVGLFFADFLCRALKRVVELDGFSHDLAPERDAARNRWMAREGHTVLRFANADVFANTQDVVSAIRLAVERLRARGVDGEGEALP